MLIAALPMAIFSEAVREYVWRITSFIDSPDGYSRLVVGVNGRPGYENLIQVTLGDTIQVTVTNDLTEPTSIHWHGITQNGTVFMDGPVGVTQCAILPGDTYVYQFIPTKAGTFWWHSHYNNQYLDGLRGPLVVLNPNDPHKDLYDEEIIVLLEDWYHNQSSILFTSFADPNSYLQTNEPVWSSGLINGRGQYDCSAVDKTDPFISCTYRPLLSFLFTHGKSYRLRIINASGFASFNFSIEGHAMSVIEADSIDIYPTPLVTSIFINTAQRYSAIVKADQKISQYIMKAYLLSESPYTSLPEEQFDRGNLNTVQAIIKYEGILTSDKAPFHAQLNLNHSMLTPINERVPQHSTKTITFAFEFAITDEEPENFARIKLNHAKTSTVYKEPTIPTLFDVVYNGKNSSTLPTTTNAIDINSGDVIDLVVFNYDGGEHPFHLHGHDFWVINLGNTPNIYNLPTQFNLVNPLKRDTETVSACILTEDDGICLEPGYLVLRFVADNPGVWLFHCHIDWHFMMGLSMTFIESAQMLRDGLLIIPNCCSEEVLQELNGFNSLALLLTQSICLAFSFF